MDSSKISFVRLISCTLIHVRLMISDKWQRLHILTNVSLTGALFETHFLTFFFHLHIILIRKCVHFRKATSTHLLVKSSLRASSLPGSLNWKGTYWCLKLGANLDKGHSACTSQYPASISSVHSLLGLNLT